MSKVSGVTFDGSSPLPSIVSPTESASSSSIDTLPLRFGSVKNCSIVRIGFVCFLFQAMPVIPENHGSE